MVWRYNLPQVGDAVKGCLSYHQKMIHVYIADALLEERLALRLLLIDLNMMVVGEAADWQTTLADAPTSHLDMLLVEWALLPKKMGAQSLAQLRTLCPNAIVIVLLSHADARQQAALSAGADVFISKGELPDRVAESLQLAAASIFLK